MDETEYTDYGSLMGAMSGLTGVVSVNSQYGRKDKPIREKTNGEMFARFIGLDDDASTFSDNTGMSLSTMFTAATGREVTGRTAFANATGMLSAGGTFQRERSGMSKVSFKTQGTQHSKQSQRSHRSKESQATGRSKQSQRSQRSHRLDQQPPRPSATTRPSMPKTTTVSFEEPVMDFGEPSYSTRGPGRDGSTFTPRFIPQDNADKVARAAAALMLDNKSTFLANSWDTMTTANRSVSTLSTKKSHVELVGRKEQGVVLHKAMLNPPNVSTAILEEKSYDEDKCGKEFNRSHLDGGASDNATADDKSTRSGGSSKDSKRSKSSTAYGSINSNETTGIVTRTTSGRVLFFFFQGGRGGTGLGRVD